LCSIKLQNLGCPQLSYSGIVVTHMRKATPSKRDIPPFTSNMWLKAQ